MLIHPMKQESLAPESFNITTTKLESFIFCVVAAGGLLKKLIFFASKIARQVRSDEINLLRIK